MGNILPNAYQNEAMKTLKYTAEYIHVHTDHRS